MVMFRYAHLYLCNIHCVYSNVIDRFVCKIRVLSYNYDVIKTLFSCDIHSRKSNYMPFI